MLISLHVENYALIRQTDVEFGAGFVAITGETGAGKSILLGALGLLLGQRADASVLSDKESKCIVEAQFDITGLPLEPLFTEADVDYDNTLILRREILPSAKSRAFANDTPVQLAFLKQLAPHIIDIHSQHQTLTLHDRSFRLSLLDSIGDPAVRQAYDTAYSRYAQLKHELEQLTAIDAENRREQDYIQFQYTELAEAHLSATEQESLEQESLLLAHAEAIQEGMSAASVALDDETEYAALHRLREAKAALDRVATFHPAGGELLGRLSSALIELDDINNELQSVAGNINYSPERQQQVEERLSLLYRLEKKHGVDSEEALIAIREELDQRLQTIASLDDRIHDLMEHVDQAFGSLQAAAEDLTRERTRAGSLLEANLLPTLHELGMPEARFHTELVATDTYTAQGHDVVRFLFNANRGGDLRDLSDIASGGEMSRLMLAIKSMLTSHNLLPTIIFDEIDTGVSGDIAGAVARIMCRMAASMQVIAITHLPQIAARANQHIKVYKQADDERTVSHLKQLSADERLVEIATMLSGIPPTQAALQTARELMQ